MCRHYLPSYTAVPTFLLTVNNLGTRLGNIIGRDAANNLQVQSCYPAENISMCHAIVAALLDHTVHI